MHKEKKTLAGPMKPIIRKKSTTSMTKSHIDFE
jgi:hypothetical protein